MNSLIGSKITGAQTMSCTSAGCIQISSPSANESGWGRLMTFPMMQVRLQLKSKKISVSGVEGYMAHSPLSVVIRKPVFASSVEQAQWCGVAYQAMVIQEIYIAMETGEILCFK